MRVHEAVAIMPCDNCGADTETRVTQTIYASEDQTSSWECANCGHFHHIQLGGDS